MRVFIINPWLCSKCRTLAIQKDGPILLLLSIWKRTEIMRRTNNCQMRQNIELRLVKCNYINTWEREKQLKINSGEWICSVWEELQGGEEYQFSQGWQVSSLGDGGTFLFDSWRKPRHLGSVLPGPGQIPGAGIRNLLMFLLPYSPHKEGSFPWHYYKWRDLPVH